MRKGVRKAGWGGGGGQAKALQRAAPADPVEEPCGIKLRWSCRRQELGSKELGSQLLSQPEGSPSERVGKCKELVRGLKGICEEPWH